MLLCFINTGLTNTCRLKFNTDNFLRGEIQWLKSSKSRIAMSNSTSNGYENKNAKRFWSKQILGFFRLQCKQMEGHFLMLTPLYNSTNPVSVWLHTSFHHSFFKQPNHTTFCFLLLCTKWPDLFQIMHCRLKYVEVHVFWGYWHLYQVSLLE